MQQEQDSLEEANAVEERRLSKYRYKILLIIIKYTPITIALLDLLHTILSYFNINAGIVSFFGGLSVINILFVFAASYAFEYCSTHRIPLYYVVCSNLIGLYDTYFGIPCSDKELLCLYLIIAGIFIIIYTKYVIANKETIRTNNR